jgi:hypothetical protein
VTGGNSFGGPAIDAERGTLLHVPLF